MNEGEFQKRLMKEQDRQLDKKTDGRIPFYIVSEMIDEAKKELKNPEIYRKFIYKYGSSDDEYFEKLRFLYYWINKWFGDIE